MSKYNFSKIERERIRKFDIKFSRGVFIGKNYLYSIQVIKFERDITFDIESSFIDDPIITWNSISPDNTWKIEWHFNNKVFIVSKSGDVRFKGHFALNRRLMNDIFPAIYPY